MWPGAMPLGIDRWDNCRIHAGSLLVSLDHPFALIASAYFMPQLFICEHILRQTAGRVDLDCWPLLFYRSSVIGQPCSSPSRPSSEGTTVATTATSDPRRSSRRPPPRYLPGRALGLADLVPAIAPYRRRAGAAAPSGRTATAAEPEAAAMAAAVVDNPA